MEQCKLVDEPVACKHMRMPVQLSPEFTHTCGLSVSEDDNVHVSSESSTKATETRPTGMSGHEGRLSKGGRTGSRRAKTMPIRYREPFASTSNNKPSPLKYELSTAIRPPIQRSLPRCLPNENEVFSFTERLDKSVEILPYEDNTVMKSKKTGSEEVNGLPVTLTQKPRRFHGGSNRKRFNADRTNPPSTKFDATEDIHKRIKHQRINAELDRDLALMKLPFTDAAITEYLCA